MYKVFSFATGGYEQSQIDEQLVLLDKVGKKMGKDLKVLLAAKGTDAKTKKILKQVAKNEKEYLGAVADALDMLTVDVGMATPMLSVTDEVFSLLNKDLKTINKIADDDNKESYENALKKIDSTLYTLYTLIAVAFVLSFLIITAVTNSIKTPLNKFQNGLLEFFQIYE